ncbi:MAG: SigE family polymerase sigma factor [Nocardioides sp.]|jgi:DNA-directed RNA polymerase specialized sigma24 family protein|uniref:sigma factor n=1 Tax=Nocardioides sp. TaxID=35761 RepID=UPI0026075581|nr:sigma factor [Nocardioides sp.]MCW2832717.1 SigE family polymerase sigma factor [Nocardioides sp.]
METLVRAGVGMGDRAQRRDDEFAEYMHARQAGLLRTAYLLTGDRHSAEDLVQTSLAKLYLSWDRVHDRGSLDGYVRRIMVTEFASAGRKQVTLWWPAWESADTIVAMAMESNVMTLVRMRVDGTLEEVADPVDASEVADAAYFIGDNRTSL